MFAAAEFHHSPCAVCASPTVEARENPARINAPVAVRVLKGPPPAGVLQIPIA